MTDQVHQDDPTVNMSIDQRVTPNTAVVPEPLNLQVPVVPGHDMVINHADGSQELGTGNEMLAVVDAETKTGKHTPVASVRPQPEESTHRSQPDPETNQPSLAKPVAPEVKKA